VKTLEGIHYNKMKKTTIIIEGKAFTYDDEIDDITYETISPITEEDARSLLLTTKKLFDQCGLKFCLTYGTLLGAVRDHGLIKGDEDVDVFIDDEPLLRRSIPFLYENGLKVCRIMEHRLYSFHMSNNSYIDVYIKGELPFSIWKLWCDRLHNHALPRWYTYKYDTISFLGVNCLCPHKPERILHFWYGKNWRTPIKGHFFIYDVPSRYFWRNKIKPYSNTIGYFIKLAITNPLLFARKTWKRASKGI